LGAQMKGKREGNREREAHLVPRVLAVDKVKFVENR
jgi:hypothetical protein